MWPTRDFHTIFLRFLMSCFKIIPTILATLMSRWIFFFRLRYLFQQCISVSSWDSQDFMFSYTIQLQRFPWGLLSSGSKHSPPVVLYQPLKVLRKNSTWFLMLSSSHMTIFPSSTSAGYKDAGIQVKCNSVCKGHFDFALTVTSKSAVCFWTGKWCNKKLLAFIKL